ncbi:unnamed protein product, partial [Urochloa humidicola]
AFISLLSSSSLLNLISSLILVSSFLHLTLFIPLIPAGEQRAGERRHDLPQRRARAPGGGQARGQALAAAVRAGSAARRRPRVGAGARGGRVRRQRVRARERALAAAGRGGRRSRRPCALAARVGRTRAWLQRRERDGGLEAPATTHEGDDAAGRQLRAYAPANCCFGEL